jgi:hypothetical protein
MIDIYKEGERERDKELSLSTRKLQKKLIEYNSVSTICEC